MMLQTQIAHWIILKGYRIKAEKMQKEVSERRKKATKGKERWQKISPPSTLHRQKILRFAYQDIFGDLLCSLLHLPPSSTKILLFLTAKSFFLWKDIY